MRRTALATLALCAALATPAQAHKGNPDFESLVTSVRGAPGLTAEILNGDDRVLLVNEGSRTVVVEGYDGEPYARMRPGGVVEVNRNSEATYLNEDRFGQVDVPASAGVDAEPEWRQVSRTGRFEFHDHRMHWMAEGDPPQVEDKAERQKVFDWAIPLRVDAQEAAVRGTLWWRGDGGGSPVAAFAALVAFALLAVAFAVAVRRRRRQGGTGAGGRPAAGEAW